MVINAFRCATGTVSERGVHTPATGYGRWCLAVNGRPAGLDVDVEVGGFEGEARDLETGAQSSSGQGVARHSWYMHGCSGTE